MVPWTQVVAVHIAVRESTQVGMQVPALVQSPARRARIAMAGLEILLNLLKG